MTPIGWSEKPKWMTPINRWGKRTTERIGTRDPNAALKQAEGVLTFHIRTSGSDSGHATNGRAEVARWLEELDRWTEARVLRESILASYRRNRGADDRYTLYAEGWLARNLVASGMLQEAKDLFNRVLDGLTELEGEDSQEVRHIEGLIAQIEQYQQPEE